MSKYTEEEWVALNNRTMKQTSIEWLKEKYISQNCSLTIIDFDKAKEMHKVEIIDAYEKGYLNLKLGDDDAGKEYYQETFGSKGSDECQFEPTTNTSSATICKHCGRDKFLHKP